MQFDKQPYCRCAWMVQSYLPGCTNVHPPSNTCFLGPTRVHNANGILIGSAVLAGLTIVTNQQTDHATPSVTIGRIYICSTAMWPNNDNNVRISNPPEVVAA